jgi:hypothetical protein
MLTTIQRLFAPVKRWTPRFFWVPLRSVLTALATPVLFSLKTGHFRSSIGRVAVSRQGRPIPWYSYPCIDFLATRDFRGRRVLEAGAGHSTLWWAGRASYVLSMEDDAEWYQELAGRVPGNVHLIRVAEESEERCESAVKDALRGQDLFDVVIVDGLHRTAVLRAAMPFLKPDGAVICDNAEGFGFFEELRRGGLNRVDFFGFAPGVVNRHCTSIAFRERCFMFSPEIPIQVAHEIVY